jgi:hypothetical protein
MILSRQVYPWKFIGCLAAPKQAKMLLHICDRFQPIRNSRKGPASNMGGPVRLSRMCDRAWPQPDSTAARVAKDIAYTGTSSVRSSAFSFREAKRLAASAADVFKPWPFLMNPAASDGKT